MSAGTRHRGRNDVSRRRFRRTTHAPVFLSAGGSGTLSTHLFAGGHAGKLAGLGHILAAAAIEWRPWA